VPVFVSRYRTAAFRRAKTGFSININSARGKTAVAFCGIAQPESFRQALEAAGMQIAEFFRFGDHHSFTQSELQKVLGSFKKHEASYIVTTEKDVTRCLHGAGQTLIEQEPVFFLEMNVTIDEETQWQEFLGQVA
jgi:tetraacyldisaccharide 4'-kinase